MEKARYKELMTENFPELSNDKMASNLGINSRYDRLVKTAE